MTADVVSGQSVFAGTRIKTWKMYMGAASFSLSIHTRVGAHVMQGESRAFECPSLLEIKQVRPPADDRITIQGNIFRLSLLSFHIACNMQLDCGVSGRMAFLQAGRKPSGLTDMEFDRSKYPAKERHFRARVV
jgi:hypothetical protein